MKREGRFFGFNIFILIFLILISSSFVFAGLADFLNGITGWATSQTATISITVGNTAPVIGNVTLAGNINPGAITLNEAGNFTFTVYFVAHDVDGAANLNDNSPNIAVNITQATTPTIRTNLSTTENANCALVGDINAVSANYSCEVDIWYFDPSGTWNVNVSVRDVNGAMSQNSTITGGTTGLTFTVNALNAIQISPVALTWATISAVTVNSTSSSNPVLLNNTGNTNNTNVSVTAKDLRGADAITSIYATNFSVGNTTGNSQECNPSGNATKMVNGTATDINNTLLPVGNWSVNNGQTGIEEIYFCLREVPPVVTAQAYSTSGLGAWTIAIAP